MRKDKAKVYARPHGLVKSVAVDGKYPVSLERQTQGLAYGIFYTHVRIDGKKGLFVKYAHNLRRPVVFIALEHKERGFHTSTQRSTDVGYKFAMLPKPVSKNTRPEEFVVATAFGTLSDGSSRELTLKTCTEVV